jgi:hypothetical protein
MAGGGWTGARLGMSYRRSGWQRWGGRIGRGGRIGGSVHFLVFSHSSNFRKSPGQRRGGRHRSWGDALWRPVFPRDALGGVVRAGLASGDCRSEVEVDDGAINSCGLVVGWAGVGCLRRRPRRWACISAGGWCSRRRGCRSACLDRSAGRSRRFPGRRRGSGPRRPHLGRAPRGWAGW